MINNGYINSNKESKFKIVIRIIDINSYLSNIVEVYNKQIEDFKNNNIDSKNLVIKDHVKKEVKKESFNKNCIDK